MSTWNADLAIADYLQRTPRSYSLFERAHAFFPGGSTRVAGFFEPYPTYLDRGDGVFVWDVDANRRLDFDANYGLLVHGHCFPAIVSRMQEQAQRAHCFGAPTEGEIALAEAIKARVPSIERLRFTTSGSEAAALALRAARAFTKRKKVAKFSGGYHGSSAATTTGAPPADSAASGVIPSKRAGFELDDTLLLPFNDIAEARRILLAHREDVAAVIVEPVMGAAGLLSPAEGFLSALQETTAGIGALLVLDEVMMFRLGYHGAQGLWGLRPDLTLLGKVIGGGLPVGALGGRADVMSLFDMRAQDGIRHSGTYNANPMTTAAGLACLEHLTVDAFSRMRGHAEALVEQSTRVLWDARVPASIARAESFFALHCLPRPARTPAELGGQDQALFRVLHLGLLCAGVQLTATGMGSISTIMDASHVTAFVDALRFVIKRYLA